MHINSLQNSPVPGTFLSFPQAGKRQCFTDSTFVEILVATDKFFLNQIFK